jgi:hypothetical protein
MGSIVDCFQRRDPRLRCCSEGPTEHFDESAGLLIADLEGDFLDGSSRNQQFYCPGQPDLTPPGFEAGANLLTKYSLHSANADACFGAQGCQWLRFRGISQYRLSNSEGSVFLGQSYECWHWRSLLKLGNEHFKEGRLVTLPCAELADTYDFDDELS